MAIIDIKRNFAKTSKFCVLIWRDNKNGSCKDGTEYSGAAAVVTTGSARYPIELEVLQKKGSRYTCSYDEEKAAMNIALDWMLENSRSSDAAQTGNL